MSMSDSSNKFPIPQKVLEVMVDNILRKNGIDKQELKSNISDEQKQALKEMVEDLRKQVDQFSNSKDAQKEE